MKHSLQLKLSQHLTLTPQLQQSIRLLQLSTLELNQELEHMLQENPLLELAEAGGEETGGPVNEGERPGAEVEAPREETREETSTENEYATAAEDFSDTNWGDEGPGQAGNSGDGDDTQDYPQQAAETATLRQHLLWQLSLTQMEERDKRIVSLLIDALNEDGYLTQDLDELAELLPEELEIEPADLQIALNQLQNLDPPGVGARSLAECLALQLQAMPADTPYLQEALTIAKRHLEMLAARDYAKLKKILHCDDEVLRAVQSLITHLNPRPGAEYSAMETRYVVADVTVKKVKGMWLVALNPDAMPKLRINRMYADILSRNRDSSSQQLSSQLQEAKWLIKNVQQRFETILRVSQAIVDRQRHFFEHGDVAMRPLVLREIADAVGLHESTVSRVTTQKFMSTPRGIYELKYFFGSHVTTDAGGACSATAIRALIKQLVGAENTKKPLSDSQISEVLGQQGIVVARRTIAKYRESMQIPPVNLRKSL
jgi:RNA polymerase sigma-54 factor